MKLTDLYEYYDVSKDQLGTADINDTRRPRLTMYHLKKLRKMNELKNYEKSVRDQLLGVMYSGGDDADDEF